MTMRSYTSTWLWALIACAGTTLSVVIPLLFNADYYFHNDVQHYFMPIAHEIGSRISDGDWPILSLRSMYAGNYIGEGQLGLFNPVTLLLFALIAKIPNLTLDAGLYAGFHLLLLTAGTFSLAKKLTISNAMSAVTAIALVTSSMVSYVDASVWWNAITTNAWLVWSLRNWLNLATTGRSLAAAIVTTMLVLTGGWPHGSLALAIYLGALIVCCTVQPQTFIRSARLMIFGGGISALLMALPALIPLVASVRMGTRADMATTGSSRGINNIDGLFSLSWPSFLQNGVQFVSGSPSFPIAYASWFIVPVIVLYWTALREKTQLSITTRSPLIPLVLIAFTFGIMTLGPTQLGPLRWPMRFLFYYQLPLLLSVTYALSKLPDPSITDVTKKLPLLWILGALMSWQQNPGDWLIHVMCGASGLLASLAMFSTKSMAYRALLIIAGTLLIQIEMHYAWPSNENVIHFPTPESATYQTSPIDFPNTLIIQRSLHSEPDDWKFLPSGNIALWENRPFVNGYTPIQPKGLVDNFCFNNRSYICSTILERLFHIDPATHTDTATLFRIGNIRSESGALSSELATLAPSVGFALHEETENGQVWSRPLPNYPGTVSHACPHAKLESLTTAKTGYELLRIENSSTKPCRIIWARTAFPGYEAEWNEQPIEIMKHLDTLVAADIPANSSGILKLQFFPYGWRLTATSFFIGAMLLMVLVVINRKHHVHIGI